MSGFTLVGYDQQLAQVVVDALEAEKVFVANQGSVAYLAFPQQIPTALQAALVQEGYVAKNDMQNATAQYTVSTGTYVRLKEGADLEAVVAYMNDAGACYSLVNGVVVTVPSQYDDLLLEKADRDHVRVHTAKDRINIGDLAKQEAVDLQQIC